MLRKINRVLLVAAVVMLAACGVLLLSMLWGAEDRSWIDNADFVNTTGEKYWKGEERRIMFNTTMQGYMIKSKPFEPSGNAGASISPEREIRSKGVYMKEEKDRAGQ